MRKLLSDSVYLRYWLAVVASYLGDGIMRVAVIYIAAHLTTSPALFVSLVVFMQLLPSGILSVFIGPFVDRISPRVLLVGSDLFRFVVVVLMTLVTQSPMLLVILIFMEGIGKAVFETARLAAIPKVVGKHNIADAIALFQSTVHVLHFVGPLVGGFLIGYLSVMPAFGINAATFLVSALLLGSIPVLRDMTARREGDAGDYLRSLIEGVRGVIAIRSLRLVLLAIVPIMLVVGLFTTNVNTQLLNVFDLAAFEFGLAQAIIGAGATVAALLGPALIRRWPIEWLLAASSMLFALTLLLVLPLQAGWPDFGLAAVLFWCALSGFWMSLLNVPISNLLLRDLPEQLRGRGLALANTLMMNFFMIGALVGGIVADTFGVTTSIAVAGGALLMPSLGLLVLAGYGATVAAEMEQQ